MIPKYRVYIKNLKMMLPVANIDFEIEEIGTRISDDGDLLYYSFDDENIIIMQSTGLKDKNGVEIFEGDILKRYDDRLVVKWNCDTASYYISSLSDDWTWYIDEDYISKVEVSGNRFENPELIET